MIVCLSSCGPIASRRLVRVVCSLPWISSHTIAEISGTMFSPTLTRTCRVDGLIMAEIPLYGQISMEWQSYAGPETCGSRCAPSQIYPPYIRNSVAAGLALLAPSIDRDKLGSMCRARKPLDEACSMLIPWDRLKWSSRSTALTRFMAMVWLFG